MELERRGRVFVGEAGESGSDVLLCKKWVCVRMMRGTERLFSSIEEGDAERGLSIYVMETVRFGVVLELFEVASGGRVAPFE